MVAEKTSKERYRIVDGVRLIEVRVRSALQLFDARDPAPFLARDLDDSFAEYIVTSAEEFPANSPMKILIHVEELPPPKLAGEAIPQAIRSYLTYQIDLRRMRLRKMFRTARLFLGIGSVSLVACLAMARLASQMLPDAFYMPILREGLVIFGWVSLWKPVEILLFDWYPVFDRIRLLRRLLACPIEVR